MTARPFRRRKDRPHTFLHHAPSQCGLCGRNVEARAVARKGQVYELVHCPGCGPTERRLAEDADAYMREFLARGAVPKESDGDHLFKQTTSTCPQCLDLLRADVLIRAGRVYFSKHCPKCGVSEALVSEDAAWYVQAYASAAAGTEPLRFGREVRLGCPTDCGTCPDHEQHTCLPIVEITDHCNLNCPICIVDNRNSTHLSVEEFETRVDRLVEAEGRIESLAISGGEPTCHPQLLEIVRIAAQREEIGRVLLLTNGLCIGKDRDLAAQLKEMGVYVGLQFDGWSEASNTQVRGRDVREEKQAALRSLEEFDIPTQLIFVAVRGVNEDQIGRVVDLLLDKDHIVSLNFQPAAYSGRGGGSYDHDPSDRLTIPGVLRRIEEQTGGKLKMSDFSPLPCSHPQCVALTHLLRLDDGAYLPFSRFADYRKHGHLLRSSATLGATPEMEKTLKDVIYHVYANEDRLERGPEVLKALRRAVDEMFPARSLSHKEQTRAGEHQAKSIALHHYMDRHDFDLERLRKCCHHYALPDGRLMPACGFNALHRGAARGALDADGQARGANARKAVS